MIKPGLYEQVINRQLNSIVEEIPEALKAVAPIDKAEASKVLSQYLSNIVQNCLDNLFHNGGDISAQINLVNQIISVIQNATKEADFAALSVDRRAELLLAILSETDPRLAVGKPLLTLTARRPPSPGVACLPVQSKNLNCIRSLRRKLSPPIELTCWYPS